MKEKFLNIKMLSEQLEQTFEELKEVEKINNYLKSFQGEKEDIILQYKNYRDFYTTDRGLFLGLSHDEKELSLGWISIKSRFYTSPFYYLSKIDNANYENSYGLLQVKTFLPYSGYVELAHLIVLGYNVSIELHQEGRKTI